MTYSPSASDCAYLAGLIDGEGHISVVGVRDGKFTQRRLVITNVHLPTLVWVAERFGGKIHAPKRPEGERIPFQWYCYGAEVDRILLHVVTYLRIKQLEARLAVYFGSNRKRDPADRRRVDPAQRAAESSIREHILDIRGQGWTKADVPPHLLEPKPKVTECRYGHGPAAYKIGRGCRECRRIHERSSEQYHHARRKEA